MPLSIHHRSSLVTLRGCTRTYVRTGDCNTKNTVSILYHFVHLNAYYVSCSGRNVRVDYSFSFLSFRLSVVHSAGIPLLMQCAYFRGNGPDVNMGTVRHTTHHMSLILFPSRSPSLPLFCYQAGSR